MKDDSACQRAEVMKTKSVFREMMLVVLGVMIGVLLTSYTPSNSSTSSASSSSSSSSPSSSTAIAPLVTTTPAFPALRSYESQYSARRLSLVTEDNGNPQEQHVVLHDGHGHGHHESHRTHLSKEITKVVVFIPSPIQSADRRYHVNKQFHREQWPRSEVIVIWIFGTKVGKLLEKTLNVSSIYQEPFMNEQNIVLTNCRDYGDQENNANGTSATTCKFYEGMKYVYTHYHAEYIWRGADDAYLNLKKFFTMIPTLPSHSFWLGQLRNSAKTFDIDLNRQPKLKALFGLDRFSTKYMLGMGSVFSYDIAKLIATWNIPPHLTWCEDVMVGMWLMLFQIEYIHRPTLLINRAGSIANRWPLNGTYGNLSVLLVHYIRPQDWDRIYDDGTIYIPCPVGGHC